MDGYQVTDEKGNQAWWDGKNLLPLNSMEAVRSIGQQSAINEPAFQGLARATIPTAATALSLIPGVGLGTAAALGAGGTALNQAVGMEEPSGTEIAKGGLIPLAGGALAKGAKGAYRAIGKFSAPAATRAAAGEAAIENLGATGNMIDRAYEVPGSKAAYQMAEGQSPLPRAPLVGAIKQAEASTPPTLGVRPARRIMRQTAEAILPPIKPAEVPAASNMEAFIAGKQKAADETAQAFLNRPSTISWKEAIAHVQDMRNSATEFFDRGLSRAGNALQDASERVMKVLDSVSPEYERANKLYNREQSINRVAEILTKPGPSAKLGLLFQKDKMTRAAFDASEAKMLENIAKFIDTVGATGSPYSGVGGRALDFIAAPLASALRSPIGMSLMKQTFRNGVTPQAVATVGQFIRAYEAQNARPQEAGGNP